jgi:hypothetical protein
MKKPCSRAAGLLQNPKSATSVYIAVPSDRITFQIQACHVVMAIIKPSNDNFFRLGTVEDIVFASKFTRYVDMSLLLRHYFLRVVYH